MNFMLFICFLFSVALFALLLDFILSSHCSFKWSIRFIHLCFVKLDGFWLSWLILSLFYFPFSIFISSPSSTWWSWPKINFKWTKYNKFSLSEMMINYTNKYTYRTSWHCEGRWTYSHFRRDILPFVNKKVSKKSVKKEVKMEKNTFIKVNKS